MALRDERQLTNQIVGRYVDEYAEAEVFIRSLGPQMAFLIQPVEQVGSYRSLLKYLFVQEAGERDVSVLEAAAYLGVEPSSWTDPAPSGVISRIWFHRLVPLRGVLGRLSDSADPVLAALCWHVVDKTVELAIRGNPGRFAIDLNHPAAGSAIEEAVAEFRQVAPKILRRFDPAEGALTTYLYSYVRPRTLSVAAQRQLFAHVKEIPHERDLLSVCTGEKEAAARLVRELEQHMEIKPVIWDLSIGNGDEAAIGRRYRMTAEELAREWNAFLAAALRILRGR